MTTHDIMVTLGRIARLRYSYQDGMPADVRTIILARPATGFGLMMQRHTISQAMAKLVDQLPASLPEGPIKSEDQGGFWIGWNGQAGGAREGAGRKTLGEGPSVRMSLSLPQDLADFAERLGNGSKSEGIRKALEMAQKRAPQDTRP